MSEPISELGVVTLGNRSGSSGGIIPNEQVRIDRSLDSRRIHAEFGYAPSSRGVMTGEFVQSMKKETK